MKFMLEIQKQLRKKFNRVIGRYGYWELFYAIVIKNILIGLFSNPVVYVLSFFYHIKAIFPRRIPYLPGIYLFAINSLFWLRAADELKKNGLTGKSRTVADGDYSMTNWWFYTPVSLFLFRYLGVGLSAFCITAIPLTFLVFGSDTSIIIGCIFLFYASTVVFSMAFVVGRYHAAAWLAVPMIIYFISAGQLVFAGILLVWVAINSSTVLFLVSLVIVLSSALKGEYLVILFLFPACLVAMTYVMCLITKSEKIIQAIYNVVNGVGVINEGVKYKRSDVGNLSLTTIWFIIAGIFFTITFLLVNSLYPVMTILAVLLMIFNDKISRFSDTQTTHFLVVICSLSETMIYGASYQALFAPAFLIFVPQILLKTGVSTLHDNMNIIKPIDILPLLAHAKNFLCNVSEGEKVLLAFPNPKGSYSRLYDGYKHSIELMLYVGSKLNINVFPDWSMVFKYNKESSEEFWGVDPQSVKQNMKRWGAMYAIVNDDYKESSCGWLADNKNTISTFMFDIAEIKDKYSKDNFKRPKWRIIHGIK